MILNQPSGKKNNLKYDPKNLHYDEWVNNESLERIQPIFEDFQFIVNCDEEGEGGFVVSQQQMVFFDFTESLQHQFETFHGQFIITGTEFGDDFEVNIVEPYRIQITLQYPKYNMSVEEMVKKKFDSQEDIKEIVGDPQDKSSNPPWNEEDTIKYKPKGNMSEPQTMKVDKRKYIIDIYKYNRSENTGDTKYEGMGDRISLPSHSYFEFWGIPTYQTNLMSQTTLQKSYKDKNYAEIISQEQKDKLKVKEQDDFQSDVVQNKCDKYNPFIIPSGLPLTSVFDNLRYKQWVNDEIDKPSPPLWFLNNNRINFKFPTYIRPDILDVWVGDLFQTQQPLDKTVEDVYDELIQKVWNSKDENPNSPFSNSNLDEDNVGKVIFNKFMYIQRSRGQMFGLYNKRNTKHILEGVEKEGSNPIPLKHKQTNWTNLIHPEPNFKDIHEGDYYQNKYEYDQYYLDHEYSLEDRMGKKYWKQLINSFMNMDLLTVFQGNQTHYNILEKMRLGLIVRQHFKDTHWTGIIDIIHNEDQQFFVFHRQHKLYPQLNVWNIQIGLGTDQKFQMYNEDPHGTFFCSICKQFKQIRSYSQERQEQTSVSPEEYEIVPFQYNERENEQIKKSLNMK